MATDTPKEISTAASVGDVEIPIMVPTTFVATQPMMIPTAPPKELVTAASMTNCCKIVPLSAPSDFLMPISLVRSVTDTA